MTAEGKKHSYKAVKVIQPYRVVSTNGTAQVQCFIQPQPAYHQIQPSYNQSPPYPYPGPEHLRVTLLKGLHGSQELCSSILSFTEENQAAVEKKGEVQCSAQVRDGAVEVTVSGLKATDTDLYRCDIEVFYPPPYLHLIGNGTLIHSLESPDCPVQGTGRQLSLQSDEEENESQETMAPVSVSVVVLVVLVLFVLSIIIYFQTVHCAREKWEMVRSVPGGPHKVDAVACSYENVV
uniref:cytotoxic T-lymphocyte protein 4 isoform X2 n=1 Tax=Monopterus albus TaxID=43700 RepID=UPI0009B3A0BE|nr:cytotoxic T-lymphocyte protein 4-like isoform X2 [Monopterus albus]